MLSGRLDHEVAVLSHYCCAVRSLFILYNQFLVLVILNKKNITLATKMATTRTQFEEFDATKESIGNYIERTELFFIANETPAGKQVHIFLTNVGTKTYALLKDLLSPTLPKDKAIDEIFKVLTDHFTPQPIVISERYKFHSRTQKEGESIADFVAELKRLSRDCKFETHLEEALRDRFVCGLRQESFQRRLLIEEKLTFAKAVEKAQNYETVERQSAAMTNGHSSEKTGGGVMQVHQTQPCYRCGMSNHSSDKCKYREMLCFKCGKKGHLQSVCRSKGSNSNGKSQPSTVHQYSQNRHRQQHRPRPRQQHRAKYITVKEEEINTNDTAELSLFQVDSGIDRKPIHVKVLLDNKQIQMEVDTGAAVSLMSNKQYEHLFPSRTLRPSNLQLNTYTSESIRIVGEVTVTVTYYKQAFELDLVVVEGDGPPLFGRNWMRHIKLRWPQILHTSVNSPVENLVEKYEDVFKDTLGTMCHYQAKLHLKPDARPKFWRSRQVPFTLKEGIEKELNRLQEAKIIEPVSYSEWAAPIVPVPKKDGSIRLCGDYKVTLNPVLQVDQYPLPRPDELFASISGGKKFTTLDLSQAYQQMLLDDDSQKLVTINTHKWLYRYKRLPFGVAAAPAIFQRTMDMILQGIPHTICYIDDILITGETAEEHLVNLEEVLRRLRYHGVTLKRNKCKFFRDSVEYLGHVVKADGLHVQPGKVQSLINAPRPSNIVQLRAYLGLVNYYGKFIPDLSTLLAPLYKLLNKDCEWVWSEDCELAVKRANDELISPKVLMHYNPKLPLRLQTDASQYGLGAVLSHVTPEGSEKPFAFASRSLSKSESNYAHIEKEGLSIIFGIKKFNQYLLGRQFVLVTDHKPLTSIFHPHKGTNSVTASRLQCWAILLSSYNYEIKYRSTNEHCNADALSHLPVAVDADESSFSDGASSLFNISQLEALPVTVADLRTATRTDPILSKVMNYTRYGWPASVPDEFKSFHMRADELTIESECFMWGIRVIVPLSLRRAVLSEIHNSHFGMSKMKVIARSYVWWPLIDQDIEQLVRSCEECLACRNAPPLTNLTPWTWPSKLWLRLHIDYAGPLFGYYYLILTDSHTKWPEIWQLKTPSTTKTIHILRHLFSTFGLPEQIVSDNGPQFVSAEFEQFLKSNGIRHFRSAPYHPSTNGAAERLVQTFKRSFTKGKKEGKSDEYILANFLLWYRTTPHSTTGESPSSLMFM